MGFKPKQQRVTVHWRDAATYSGWAEADDDRKLVATVTSGFLLRRTLEQLEIAGTVSDLGNVNQIIVIPRKWITKMEYGR